MTAKKKRAAKKRASAAAPPNLTPAEQRCLEAFGDLVDELQREKRNPTVREVSERLGLSPMGAQEPLKKLEGKGYLKNEWGWEVIGKELAPEGQKWLAYRRGRA